MTIKTQYVTTLPFLGVTLPPAENGLPKWLTNEFDQQRVAAYAFYDDVYANNPYTYSLLLRAADDVPIYLPSAKRIINTVSRYIARDLGFTFQNEQSGEEVPEEQIVSNVLFLENFFKRERFSSRFNSAKRRGLVRGDSCLYIYADPFKAQGSRISIRWINPKTYFPIFDIEDSTKVTGAEIANLFTDSEGKEFVRVQRYIRGAHPDHPAYQTENQDVAEIIYSHFVVSVDKWQDLEEREIIETIVSNETIPGITHIPVYHFKNNEEDGINFGRSELGGIEHLIAAMNQTITDQDIALALSGLGMYVANFAPVDENGVKSDWILGPGRVVESPSGSDSTFERVSGITTVEPSLSHVRFINEQVNTTLGISDVASGQVEVNVAESGIALSLRMGPIIDAANEKENAIKDVLVQFFYDLKAWFNVYENVNFGDISIVPVFSDKMPRNRSAEFEELMSLFGEGLVTPEYVLKKLQSSFGYSDISEEMISAIKAQHVGAIGDLQAEKEQENIDEE